MTTVKHRKSPTLSQYCHAGSHRIAPKSAQGPRTNLVLAISSGAHEVPTLSGWFFVRWSWRFRRNRRFWPSERVFSKCMVFLPLRESRYPMGTTGNSMFHTYTFDRYTDRNAQMAPCVAIEDFLSELICSRGRPPPHNICPLFPFPLHVSHQNPRIIPVIS